DDDRRAHRPPPPPDRRSGRHVPRAPAGGDPRPRRRSRARALRPADRLGQVRGLLRRDGPAARA
ncbi:MAG: ATP-dependent DNA helicase RecQ, partial [uncultured Solirubrobacteraceae bacterium]